MTLLLVLAWPSIAVPPDHIRVETVAHIPIGNKASTLALSRDAKTLYAAQLYSHSIAVIDVRTRALSRTIPVSYEPKPMAVSPDGKRLYVGQWAGQSEGQISIIDTVRAVAQFVRVGGPVPDLALSADGATLYMAMCRAGLVKMDTRSGSIQKLYTQFCPWGLALSPDERSLWVNFQGRGPNGSIGHDSIARFDTATGKLLGTITGMANVGGPILASRDGKTVWADGYDACSAQPYDHAGCPAVPAGIVHVIDAPQMKVTRTLAKAREGAISFSSDETFVALAGDHLIFVNSCDFRQIGAVAGRYYQLAFSPDGQYAYATSLEAPEILVLRIRRTP